MRGPSHWSRYYPIRTLRPFGLYHLHQGAWLLLQMDTHDDILIIISETATKDIDPTRVAGRLVNPDPQPNSVMLIEFKFVERYVRYLDVVHRRSTPRDLPGDELAIL